MYFNGYGVEQNYVIAEQWFSEAANQGYAASQYSIGLIYLNGLIDGEIDLDYGESMMLKAAEQGLGEAQYALGELYTGTVRIKHNNKKGILWFTKAADNGYPEAQYKLGEMYLKGIRVEKDVQKGLDLLQKAAEQNHEDAIQMLKDVRKPY